MDVHFKFALADHVIISVGGIQVRGVVRSASIGRGALIGYWVDYLTDQNEIKETYAVENELMSA